MSDLEPVQSTRPARRGGASGLVIAVLAAIGLLVVLSMIF